MYSAILITHTRSDMPFDSFSSILNKFEYMFSYTYTVMYMVHRFKYPTIQCCATRNEVVNSSFIDMFSVMSSHILSSSTCAELIIITVSYLTMDKPCVDPSHVWILLMCGSLSCLDPSHMWIPHMYGLSK